VARDEHALNELVKECEQLGGRAVAAPADVTDEAGVTGAARIAVDTFGRIDVWVNDAAVALFGRFEETPNDAFKRVLDINFMGYVNGARAVLPCFRRQRTGVLINISSVEGKLAQPFASAYSASKAAINSLSESLRMEVRDMPGIQVCTVLMPSVDTPLFQHGANFTGRAVKPMAPVYRAETVARTIVRLAAHPRREVVIGFPARAMLWARDLMPARMETMMARKVGRDQFQDMAAPESRGNLFQPMKQWNGVSGEWLDGGRRPAGAWRAAFALGMLGAATYGYLRMRGRSRRHFGFQRMFR
jgi:short-subunit dehydrogenase